MLFLLLLWISLSGLPLPVVLRLGKRVLCGFQTALSARERLRQAGMPCLGSKATRLQVVREAGQVVAQGAGQLWILRAHCYVNLPAAFAQSNIDPLLSLIKLKMDVPCRR
ncbi:MAG TPA: hypothetical protein VH640_07390 [Bryobacteraceae bacterium]